MQIEIDTILIEFCNVILELRNIKELIVTTILSRHLSIFFIETVQKKRY